jgi:hypothetical protein
MNEGTRKRNAEENIYIITEPFGKIYCLFYYYTLLRKVGINHYLKIKYLSYYFQEFIFFIERVNYNIY